MKKNKKIFAELLLSFMKIGLFTFGGGYAMIAMISSICVEKKKWISQDEMMNLTVIAESTPGPIAINAATYIGFKEAGFSGALLSTFGIILPSFVIIYLISGLLGNFLEIRAVAAAFEGIKIAVGLLILDAALGMIRKMPGKPFQLCVMLCSAGIMLAVRFLSLPVSSIALMAAAGAVGLISALWGRKGAGRK